MSQVITATASADAKIAASSLNMKTNKQKRTLRAKKRALRTPLEKLQAAVALEIEGPLGELIRAACESTAVRERGRQGKGRVR